MLAEGDINTVIVVPSSLILMDESLVELKLKAQDMLCALLALILNNLTWSSDTVLPATVLTSPPT